MQPWNPRRAGRAAACLTTAAAVVGAAAGCGGSDKKSTPKTEGSAKPASFAVEATAQGKKKLAISFPASVPAGLVTISLKNSDKQPRAAQIIRMVGNHSVDDVLKIVDQDTPKIPDWIKDGGGVSAVAPGKTGTVTQNLAPGRYAIWDDQSSGGGPGNGPTNDTLGAKGEFTVTGAASNAELPSVPATITATDKGDTGYKFSTSGLKAGTNQVRFENTGKQVHHALLFPLNKGATLADVKKFAASQGNSGGPPPIDFANGTGTEILDSGNAQNTELTLKAGTYVVLCFLSDRDGGKPHVVKGMLKQLDVK